MNRNLIRKRMIQMHHSELSEESEGMELIITFRIDVDRPTTLKDFN